MTPAPYATLRKRIEKKMDRDELQIQGLKWNLDQLCTWLARLFFAAGDEPGSKRYFVEACSDASNC